MAGHSLGGDATSATMLADTRVKAGINLDGTINATLPATGLGDRPFLLMGSQSDHSPAKDHTWPVLNGWNCWLTVAQAHDSFTDLSIAASKAGCRIPAVRTSQRSRPPCPGESVRRAACW
jgi:hypothetical protein